MNDKITTMPMRERAARSMCRQFDIPEERWEEWPESIILAGREMRFAMIDLLLVLPWPLRQIGQQKLNATP